MGSPHKSSGDGLCGESKTVRTAPNETVTYRWSGIVRYWLWRQKLMSKSASKSNPNPAPLSPGHPAHVSGQYKMIGPRGGRTGIERTSTEGRLLPPILQPRQKYIPVDPTNTKGQRQLTLELSPPVRAGFRHHWTTARLLPAIHHFLKYRGSGKCLRRRRRY